MKLLDILNEGTEYLVKYTVLKDKDFSKGTASYKDEADAKKFFNDLQKDDEVISAILRKKVGPDSSMDAMGGAAKHLGSEYDLDNYTHPAYYKKGELEGQEKNIRSFLNSPSFLSKKRGFTNKDGSDRWWPKMEGLEEGFGDQAGAAVSGIGKGISSVLSTLIGGVIAIGVLIVAGVGLAANGVLAVLGIAGIGLIKAVEQFIIIPKINATLKRLSEDEEVMAIAKKPSASGLRKIAEEKLTSGERLLVGDWIKKNVTRSMLGVSRGRKTKKGPGLGKYDYMGLTEETSLEEGLAKSAIMRQIKDAEEILDSGEADGVPLDNETEMLVQQELARLKRMLAMNEEIPDVNTDFSVDTDFSADLEEIYKSIK